MVHLEDQEEHRRQLLRAADGEARGSTLEGFEWHRNLDMEDRTFLDPSSSSRVKWEVEALM